jgi:acetylornithine deacetylase
MNTSINQLQPILEHLQNLVSFDTRNPPRSITQQSPIFIYLQQHLEGFEFKFYDAGDGCISLLAKRGTADLLFNFHIDTVPAVPSWKTDPLALIVDDQVAIGLGACDIKGASACMLHAISETSGNVALLFSSDEEHGSSAAIKYFLQHNQDYNSVIVSEPTAAKAVLAHRGIQTAKIKFSGTSGHASEARAITDSAIHRAGKWIHGALNWVEQKSESFESLSGLPFNIGTVDGGIKANMIASACDLSFGFRPLPGQDAKVMLNELQQMACEVNQISTNDVQLNAGFSGPTLPASNQDFNHAINKATQLVSHYGLVVSEAVNFWTEASLFSQAGLTAIVYGPGHIEQAHTADEWVSLEQLEQVCSNYQKIINQSNNQTNNFSGQSHE